MQTLPRSLDNNTAALIATRTFIARTKHDEPADRSEHRANLHAFGLSTTCPARQEADQAADNNPNEDEYFHNV